MRNHPVRWLATLALSATLLPACTSEPEEVAAETSAIVPSPPFYGDPANQAVFGVDVSHYEPVLAQREVDCFWESGVRHVIVGTQVEEITRQQLAMSVSRGMTVDAYVYLLWDKDMTAQVEEAFRRAQGFPIGRMWLDVEEDPRGLGANPLGDLVQAAVDACQKHASVTCGIYTGPGFWETYMNNMTRFAAVPLWYAQYNKLTSLDAWKTEAFGGWPQPVGKQWAEQPLCGIGVDKDTIQVSAQPTVVVDRTLPPDDKLPPAAPTGLYPADGSVVGLDYVKLMVATIPRATGYQLALERWDGTAFRVYFTWSPADPFLKTYPTKHDSVYRFRARAKNAYGWGAWSSWSIFDYGKYSGPRPGAAPTSPTPTPPTPTTPTPTPPSPQPSPTGGPTGLAPDGQTVSSSSVNLSCAPVSGATRYEFSLEYQVGGGFTPYVTYVSTKPSKLFYPQVHNTTYRFRVRAETGTFGPWSAFASFTFN